jgi:nucleoside-diphosphate-sugar epimerase
MIEFPEEIRNTEQLEELLSRPSIELIEYFKILDGDIIFLGISGKIGPSLAQMVLRACKAAGVQKRVYGVSRFRSDEEIRELENIGVTVIRGDLLDADFVKSLPLVKNVFFLAGMKFGSEENLSMTWAVNTFMPALVVEHFKDSKIVAFSTGCVYPLVSVDSGGSLENDMPLPTGEYAQSCLGRERMFEYGSKKNHTPVALIRLNYSVEPRYGVLVDIATKVKNQQEIDLSMGHFNVIWQGDSNDVVIRSLAHVASPAKIINITGEETLLVRDVAEQFGELFGVKPILVGKEAPTALLNNSNQAFELFGKPKVSIPILMKWIAGWISEGKKLHGKPTHFEVRDGKY